MVQLLTPYTDRQRRNAQRYRQTDRRQYTYVYSPMKATCQTYRDREKQTVSQTDRQTNIHTINGACRFFEGEEQM